MPRPLRSGCTLIGKIEGIRQVGEVAVAINGLFDFKDFFHEDVMDRRQTYSLFEVLGKVVFVHVHKLGKGF